MSLMKTAMTCPTCSEDLIVQDEGTFSCTESHHYTVIGLALTTNIAALRSLWMAIRALEADAASLHYMAQHYGSAEEFGLPASERRKEADAAYEAATVLRGHARRAQARLDALPVAPLSSSEPGAA
jgi:hypothetical protein